MKIPRSAMLLFAGALLTLALAACGSDSGAKAFSADQVRAMVQAGAFSEELEELSGDVAFALYQLGNSGLSPDDLTDCAALRSAGATCEEGAVLIFRDEQSAQTAKEAMQSYLAAQIDANRSYRPEEIPKLENAVLEQKGPTVALAVAADVEAAKTALGL